MRARLGIAHFTTISTPPTMFASMAAAIGYTAIGLRLWPAFPGAPFYTITANTQAMRDMKSILSAAGISVFDIEFVVIDGTFNPDDLKGTLESAGELGAQRLSICGDDQDTSRLSTNLARLAELAQPYGISIDIENMPWRTVASFGQSLSIACASGAPNIGTLIDALHFSRGGGIPADIGAAPAAYIKHFQLCDADGPRPPATHALIAEARAGRKLPGHGSLPLVAMLRELPLDCALSVEVPLTSGQAEEHAQAVFDAAQAVIAEARI
jgi:sugar phosphate isomerase/epimerase